MKRIIAILISILVLNTGCDSSTPTSPSKPPPAPDYSKPIRTEAPSTMETTAVAVLPFERAVPKIGTRIQDIIPTGGEGVAPEGVEEYQMIRWENLELPGQGMADIIKQYQPQIDRIPEGDPEEDKVMEAMQVALNTAPVNPAMQGKKIRLPGFITPLEIDDSKGLVTDFLLVPYYGACIHLPPPPLSQTIFVRAQEGKGIGLERIAEPVWVYGTLSAETTKTDLANAGYQIKQAYVELYQGQAESSLNFNPITQ